MCNRCTLSVTENKLLAVFSGGSERSRVRKFQGAKVPHLDFRSRERMVLGAKSPVPLPVDLPSIDNSFKCLVSNSYRLIHTAVISTINLKW